MKAGRELDRLVAEKVFGMIECDQWQPISFGSAGGTMLQKTCDHEKCWPSNTVPNMNGDIGGIPKYSTDPVWSKKVLDEMLDRLPHKDIHIEHLDDSGWSVSTCYEEDGWQGWVSGDTLEHSICLAALKMFGVE